jgi:hypothetical protein
MRPAVIENGFLHPRERAPDADRDIPVFPNGERDDRAGSTHPVLDEHKPPLSGQRGPSGNLVLGIGHEGWKPCFPSDRRTQSTPPSTIARNAGGVLAVAEPSEVATSHIGAT